MLRLLLKLSNTAVLISNHNTKTAGFLNGNRHTRDCNICLVRFVEIQHHFVIHLIDMVTGKDQYIIRVILLHISQILIDRIGSSCIPFAACALLIWRKDCDTAFIAVQIPRNTDTDMCIQAERLVLCQHTHRVNSRVNTIAQWKIDDTIFTTKSDCRLCNLFCQNS